MFQYIIIFLNVLCMHKRIYILELLDGVYIYVCEINFVVQILYSLVIFSLLHQFLLVVNFCFIYFEAMLLVAHKYKIVIFYCIAFVIIKLSLFLSLAILFI